MLLKKERDAVIPHALTSENREESVPSKNVALESPTNFVFKCGHTFTLLKRKKNGNS